MRTTYFLGAGASAEAIPMIDGLVKEIEIFKELLIHISKLDLTDLDPRILKFQSNLTRLIDIYEKMIFESIGHQTIDTLARKYYLTNNWNAYKQLKIGLAVYFLYTQFFDRKIHSPFNIALCSTHITNLDKRYDSLFATLLNKNNSNKIDINQNVSIITWNYDIQIELALHNYENEFINKIKNKYNILPNRICFDGLDTSKHSGFKVFKLNGNAFLDLGHYLSKESTIYDTLLNKIKNEEFLKFDFFLGELLETISAVKGFSTGNESTFLRYFNFSWENPDDESRCYSSKNDVIRFARNTIEETDCLVIIGYSFPDFNWAIDSFLFEKSKFSKIIVQDKDPQKIENRLMGLLPQLMNRPSKDNIKPQIIKMTPDKYFPTNF